MYNLVLYKEDEDGEMMFSILADSEVPNEVEVSYPLTLSDEQESIFRVLLELEDLLSTGVKIGVLIDSIAQQSFVLGQGHPVGENED